MKLLFVGSSCCSPDHTGKHKWLANEMILYSLFFNNSNHSIKTFPIFLMDGSEVSSQRRLVSKEFFPNVFISTEVNDFLYNDAYENVVVRFRLCFGYIFFVYLRGLPKYTSSNFNQCSLLIAGRCSLRTRNKAGLKN